MNNLFFTLIGATIAFAFVHSVIGFITAGVAFILLIMWAVGDW